MTRAAFHRHETVHRAKREKPMTLREIRAQITRWTENNGKVTRTARTGTRSWYDSYHIRRHWRERLKARLQRQKELMKKK